MAIVHLAYVVILVGMLWHVDGGRASWLPMPFMVRDDPKLKANDVDTTAFVTDIPAEIKVRE